MRPHLGFSSLISNRRNIDTKWQDLRNMQIPSEPTIAGTHYLPFLHSSLPGFLRGPESPRGWSGHHLWFWLRQAGLFFQS